MQNNQEQTIEEIIACNFGAIDPTQRGAHETISENIFASVQEIKELPDGYAFRLPPEAPMLYKAVEWIANERLCCPFFTFSLVAAEEKVWLQLSGTQEVKGYIKAGIVDPVLETGALNPEITDFIKAGNPLSEIATLTKE